MTAPVWVSSLSAGNPIPPNPPITVECEKTEHVPPLLPRTFPQHCSGRRGGAHANGAQTEPCGRLQDREARTLTHFLHAFSLDFTTFDADENEQHPTLALCTMHSH